MSAKNTKTIKLDKAKNNKSRAGRKPKYNNEIHERIKAYARDGLTDKEICKKIGIGQTAFYAWLKQYPKLKKALKKCKEVVDDGVVDSLLKSASGFYYDEVTEIDGPKGYTKKVTRKYVEPNPTSAIFWLKNRQPDKWRAKHDGDLNDNGNMQELINAVKGIFNS